MQKELNLVPYRYGYGNPYTMTRDEKRFYRREMIQDRIRWGFTSLQNIKHQVRLNEAITLGKSLRIF